MTIVSEADPVDICSVGELAHHVADTLFSTKKIRWFRGHRRAEWSLLPLIWRTPHAYTADDERNFTNRFRTRAALRMERAPAEHEYAGWLSLMQHYGLPTRLLDWSRSPLVAAYFATADYIKAETEPEAAVIWMLEPHTMNDINRKEAFTPPIDSNTASEMLEPAFKSRADDYDILAVMAVEHDMRMFIQQGAFTIHSARDALNERQGSSRFLQPLRIPAECVKAFAWQVIACGFRRGDIYPDLSNLAEELKGAP